MITETDAAKAALAKALTAAGMFRGKAGRELPREQFTAKVAEVEEEIARAAAACSCTVAEVKAWLGQNLNLLEQP